VSDLETADDSTNLRPMSSTGTVVLRRTWPQRLVILCTVGVIGAALAVSWFLDDVYDSVTRLGRVDFAADVLLTDTEPGEPVNFLLIGEDSALGLDPDDPAAFGREYDDRGTFHADSISILRVNPLTGQAWVLSVPRDLLVEHQGGERQLNVVLLVSGHNELVETVTDNFGIPINHYMSLDFLGFREVVDELDGIPVWFEREARDWDEVKRRSPTGLLITTPGCTVLNGEQALQYVRSRHYQELIDGDWQYVGNSDFGRVERQQDFLVLAMERAIDRGARNPSNLASLIAAGAESIVLDHELTVAELVEVGEAFSDFNPDNLERYELSVSTIYDDVTGNYLGERPIVGANDDIFAIFRGEADLRAAADVSFDLYGGGEATERIAIELGEQGFNLDSVHSLEVSEDDSVVIYPTGERAAAETVARYLEPIPRLVEDPDATSLSLVLGAAHEQVLIFFPHEVPKMRAAVAELGVGPIPTLAGATQIGTATTSSTTSAPTSSTAAPGSTTTTTTTTTSLASAEPVVPTTTAGVIGSAPEGQSCG